MNASHPDYDSFESVVPIKDIREIYRRNDFNYLLSEQKRMTQICIQQGYAEDDESAGRFILGYILYMQKKYGLKTPLHPVSYRGGYRFVRRMQ